MNMIEYPLPDWIKILFLLTIPVPMILTTFLAGSAFPKPQSTKVLRTVSIFFLAYITYVTAMGMTDKFDKISFPPQVLLLTTIPFIVFLFLYLARTRLYKKFIENIALDSLVQVHIFRLIGIFFILIATYDALPKWFAMITGTGDILVALTSIWIANIIRNKWKNYKRITWLWNTFGLIDILFTAASANVLTKLAIDRGIMGVDTLAVFPFYFIPALAPPIIIFLHYTTYLKLRNPLPDSIS